MSRRSGLALMLVAASVALGADAPSPFSRIRREPDFVKRVDDAIDRGVAWLKKAQLKGGSFGDFPGYPGGTTALAYFTMRVCGVPRDDPAATTAWEALKRDYKKSDLKTYSAALYLMAFTEHGDKVDRAKDDRDVRLSPEDMKWATEIARCLAGGQNGNGVWSYDVEPTVRNPGSALGGARNDPSYDHSNTQYALLGLKCAARCGIAIERAVWRKSLAHFMESQETNGPDVPRFVPSAPSAADRGKTSASAPRAVVDRARGWSYTSLEDKRGVRQSYPSMSAAGVSSVVICRSELMGTHEMTPKLEADSERSTWDGLAWLGTRWNAPRNGAMPRGFGVNFYEYYGVERAGMLAGVEWMAGLDWYGAGAPPILDAQTADGAWAGQYGAVARNAVGGMLGLRGGDVVDTCFALLFLKKGTAPVRMGAVTQLGGDTDINFAEGARVEGKDFDDFVDLVLSRWRHAEDESVKKRIFDGATTAGPKLVEPLIVRLSSPEFLKRASANELLKRATGLDFGYVPEAEDDAREDAVVKWQTWWMTVKDHLAYDAASKRLVVQ